MNRVLFLVIVFAMSTPSNVSAGSSMCGYSSDNMVLIKGGCFEMGDAYGDGDLDEKRIRRVCVGDFYLSKFEVTQREWKTVMGESPSKFSSCGANCPVEHVSWEDVQKYFKKIGARLPTEAEWEYAARGAEQSYRWAGTNVEASLEDYAWHDANSDKSTHPVGQKQPNEFGLYDMSGNVWEWVSDWYGSYSTRDENFPTGSRMGTHRVMRGGSWDENSMGIRATKRNRALPERRDDTIGFRCARDK